MIPLLNVPPNLTEKIGDLFSRVGRHDQALLLLTLLEHRKTVTLLRLQAKVGRGARRLAESLLLAPIPLIEAETNDPSGERTLPEQNEVLKITNVGRVTLTLTSPHSPLLGELEGAE